MLVFTGTFADAGAKQKLPVAFASTCRTVGTSISRWPLKLSLLSRPPPPENPVLVFTGTFADAGAKQKLPVAFAST